jgi:hypothetical protein
VAYFAGDLPMYVWLSLEALRIWSEHGPSRTLVGSAGIAAFAAVAVHGDYAAGYQAIRRVLALGEARGYEPDASQVRFLFAALSTRLRCTCRTARRPWRTSSPPRRRAWLSRAVPAAPRPANCSSPTAGWLVCCAARALPGPVRPPPPNGTPAIRWRYSSRISPAGSPLRSLAISPVSCATPKRRCPCCRPPRAPT